MAPQPKNSTITRIEKIPKTLIITLTLIHDQLICLLLNIQIP
jgi:hypothetical protein